MKRQRTHSELFAEANKVAADIIRRDKRPSRFKIDPVTRTKVYEPKVRKYTRAQALSFAFKELYKVYDVVVRLDPKEIVKRESERLEYDRVMKFYSNEVWNAGNWTGD